MKNKNTLYALYREVPYTETHEVPGESSPCYNTAWDLELAGHVIIGGEDDEPEPWDLSEFIMKPLGVLPKESKIC
jgi:hypothetical protein